MARIVLVHGSCHGAWCWRDLAPELAALGHAVEMLDLPGSPGHPMPHKDVTLSACADAVLELVRAGPPAIVVGHSWGGFPITAAAEKDDSGIARLVYLAAYLPMDGLSLMEMRLLSPFQSLASYMKLTEDEASFCVPVEHQRGLFLQDCGAETVAYAARHLGPQAIRPQKEALAASPRARALPRSYIICTEDQTIAPDFQEIMAEDLPAADRHRIDTGHSPFFADPVGLARLIHRIAEG